MDLNRLDFHFQDAWAAVYFSRVYTNDFAVYAGTTAFYSIVLGSMASYMSGSLSDYLESKRVAGAKVTQCLTISSNIRCPPPPPPYAPHKFPSPPLLSYEYVNS